MGHHIFVTPCVGLSGRGKRVAVRGDLGIAGSLGKGPAGSTGLTQVDPNPGFRSAQSLPAGRMVRTLQTPVSRGALFPELLGRQGLQGAPCGETGVLLAQVTAEEVGTGVTAFSGPS